MENKRELENFNHLCTGFERECNKETKDTQTKELKFGKQNPKLCTTCFNEFDKYRYAEKRFRILSTLYWASFTMLFLSFALLITSVVLSFTHSISPYPYIIPLSFSYITTLMLKVPFDFEKQGFQVMSKKSDQYRYKVFLTKKYNKWNNSK